MTEQFNLLTTKPASEGAAAMCRIGLLGGMSWESSVEYYRRVNEAVRDRLGGLHSADCILRSLDFAHIEELQRTGRWDEAARVVTDEAILLCDAGADILVLCTNTMHKVAEQIQEAIPVPLLHIADTTAEAVRDGGYAHVGLLATAYTMEQEFYVGRLRDRHGLHVLLPGAADRRLVHDVIYRELCRGIIRDDSRVEYRRVMQDLADRGAECLLFGCTEIDLLVRLRGLATSDLRHQAPACREGRRARVESTKPPAVPGGRRTELDSNHAGVRTSNVGSRRHPPGNQGHGASRTRTGDPRDPP